MKISFHIGLLAMFLYSTLCPAQAFDPSGMSGCILWLDGTSGIVKNNGAVAQWNNLAQDKYNAVQSHADRMPAVLYEEWVGHTLIHFDGIDDYLLVENSTSDFQLSEAFSVFFVGRVNTIQNDKRIGVFLGNYSDESPQGGWGFRTTGQGAYDFIVGNGTENNTLGGDGLFGENFVLLNANYSDIEGKGHISYFSSLLENEVTSDISPLHLSNSDNGLIIGRSELSDSKTSVGCDIAEIIVFNRCLSGNERDSIWHSLQSKYDIYIGNPTVFVENFSPKHQQLPDAYEVAVDEPIRIMFNTPMDISTVVGISVTCNGAPDYPRNSEHTTVEGEWSCTSDSTELIFTPNKNYAKGDLIMVNISPALKSIDGNEFVEGSESNFSFIVDNGVDLSVTTELVDTMAIVKHDDGSDHILPLELILPHTQEKMPIMFWVHGGGWSGGNSGSMERSDIKAATYPDYLSRKLGVAIANISWRSLNNSQGSFQKAMEDVSTAIQYIRENADKYNIDTTRMGLYGGSAGTPMSALTSQLDKNITCYVGFNGLYDFANRTQPFGFGGGTGFNQHIPSLEENSAINHIWVPGPNTLLLHGDADLTIEHQQSLYYADAINQAGGSAEVLIYKDEPHAFFNPGNTAHIPTMYATGRHLIYALLDGKLPEDSLWQPECPDYERTLEDFNNAGSIKVGANNTKSITGTSGVTYNVGAVRTAENAAAAIRIDGSNAILMITNSGVDAWMEFPFHCGVDSVGFLYSKAFTSNETPGGITVTLGDSIWYLSADENQTIYTFSKTGLNISKNNMLRIEHTTDTEVVVLDNLGWRLPFIDTTVIDTTLIDTTLIKDHLGSNEDITVFPNPVSDVLFLKSAIEIKKVYLSDLSGKMLLSHSGHKNLISFSDYPNGMYFLFVATANVTKALKILHY